MLIIRLLLFNMTFYRWSCAHMEVRRFEKTVGGNDAESYACGESSHPIYDIREH